MIIVSVSILQFSVRTDGYIFAMIVVPVSLLRSSRSMELVLCCYSWLLSIAKEWYISEIVYPTAYEKVTRSARGSIFSILYAIAVAYLFQYFLGYLTISYGQIKHGAVVEWTLVQVQLQILFTPLLFSCDALVVMASSLPSTLLLVIHCLAWLPFLLTANSSIALWMIREMYFAECLWVMTKHKGAHVNARGHNHINEVRTHDSITNPQSSLNS